MGLRGADEEITRAIIALRHRGMSWGQVQAELSRQYGIEATQSAVCNRYHYYVGKISEEPGEKPVPSSRPETPETPHYDDVVVSWNEWLGRRVGEIVAAPAVEEGDSRRIGLICDTHCPFENREVVAAFVANGPYDKVVLAGDFLDFLPVSPFAVEKGCSFQEEIQHGVWVLETLSRAAGEVLVIGGNHGRRILKKLTNAHLPVELLGLLRWLQPQLDLYRLCAEGLPNVRIIDEEITTSDGSRVVLNFLVQLGDAIIGHPDLSRKVRLKGVETFREWLTEWRSTLGLHPFRVVAQGHTHQMGMTYAMGGAELFMELGAAVSAEGMSYATRGKCHWRPPIPGFTTLVQHKEAGGWRTNLNTVRQWLIRH